MARIRSPVSLSTLVFTRSMEDTFSTRSLAFSSSRPSSCTSMLITFSGSVIWLWITEMVQTVRLSARTVPVLSRIFPLAALISRSRSWRSSAFSA